MSELIDVRGTHPKFRKQLLATASVAVMLTTVYGIAEAADDDRPQVWIELGGQLSRLDNGEERIDPAFFDKVESIGLESPLGFEKLPRYSFDEYGRLTFQPHGSEWTLSASIRYGKSSNKKHVQQHAAPTSFVVTGDPSGTPTKLNIPSFGKFSDTQWASTESHTILDFRVGKDVGLGLFGRDGKSTISAGVRLAQFSIRTTTDVNADPTIQYPTHTISFLQAIKYHVPGDLYWQHDDEVRTFHGVGPSLSWQGSAAVIGTPEDAQILFDWDINAAVLFGRQRASGHHQSSHLHFNKLLISQGPHGAPTYIGPYVTHSRSRSVTVPNVGGSLGLSFRSGDAKVSFGYHADLFFGAIDSGIDARKTSDVLFHGPYASISIGLGG